MPDELRSELAAMSARLMRIETLLSERCSLRAELIEETREDIDSLFSRMRKAEIKLAMYSGAALLLSATFTLILRGLGIEK